MRKKERLREVTQFVDMQFSKNICAQNFAIYL